MSLDAAPTSDNRNVAAVTLAVLCLLYVWIGVSPFRSLVDPPNLVTGESQSNLLNQALALGVFGGMILLALRLETRALLMQPRGLLFILIAWFFVVTIGGDAGATGARRLLLACLLIGAASTFLLLPRDEKQLARILMWCAGVVLFLCYAGVVLTPGRSIHQAYDYVEPALAGDWRGLFDHKNNAAPSMVLLVFVGLFVRTQGYKALGLAIVVFAAFFLVKTGGKSALMLLPTTLVLAWLVERVGPFLRAVIVIGAVGGYTALTVGSVMWPQISDFVGALGVDVTFTGRTDIWELAIEGIRSSPITGHGYEGFWGNGDLVFGFREEATWAVAAPTAHNSYVDVLLTSGVIGLAILLVWLIVLPLRDLSHALDRKGREPLLRMFVRMWIFGLILGGMESSFMATQGTLWFMMMVAVFGMRLEASADRKASAVSADANRLALRPA